MKILIYGLGAMLIGVLLINLFAAAMAAFGHHHHDVRRTAIRDLTVLSCALAFSVWAAQRLASLPLLTWQHSAEQLGCFVHAYKTWLIGAGATSVVGLLTMGATGMLLFWAADAVFNLLLAHPLGWPSPPGDSVWPTAILYSLIAPWVTFAVFLVLERAGLATQPRLFLPGTAAITFLVFLLIQTIYRRLN